MLLDTIANIPQKLKFKKTFPFNNQVRRTQSKGDSESKTQAEAIHKGQIHQRTNTNGEKGKIQKDKLRSCTGKKKNFLRNDNTLKPHNTINNKELTQMEQKGCHQWIWVHWLTHA